MFVMFLVAQVYMMISVMSMWLVFSIAIAVVFPLVAFVQRVLLLMIVTVFLLVVRVWLMILVVIVLFFVVRACRERCDYSTICP
jgi:hypothetical protein